jgi:hypothetical protein
MANEEAKYFDNNYPDQIEFDSGAGFNLNVPVSLN